MGLLTPAAGAVIASLTDQQALAAYAAGLAQSSRAFLKAAVGRWARAMATAVKSGATPDNVNQVQATLYRFETLQKAIQVEAAKGQKAHTWLSPMEVKRLMSLPRLEKPIARRDKIALGLCVAAGLRREEAVSLRFDDIALLCRGQQETYGAECNREGSQGQSGAD